MNTGCWVHVARLFTRKKKQEKEKPTLVPVPLLVPVPRLVPVPMPMPAQQQPQPVPAPAPGPSVEICYVPVPVLCPVPGMVGLTPASVTAPITATLPQPPRLGLTPEQPPTPTSSSPSPQTGHQVPKPTSSPCAGQAASGCKVNEGPSPGSISPEPPSRQDPPSTNMKPGCQSTILSTVRRPQPAPNSSHGPPRSIPTGRKLFAQHGPWPRSTSPPRGLGLAQALPPQQKVGRQEPTALSDAAVRVIGMSWSATARLITAMAIAASSNEGASGGAGAGQAADRAAAEATKAAVDAAEARAQAEGAVKSAVTAALAASEAMAAAGEKAVRAAERAEEAAKVATRVMEVSQVVLAAALCSSVVRSGADKQPPRSPRLLERAGRGGLTLVGCGLTVACAALLWPLRLHAAGRACAGRGLDGGGRDMGRDTVCQRRRGWGQPRHRLRAGTRCELPGDWAGAEKAAEECLSHWCNLIRAPEHHPGARRASDAGDLRLA